MGCRRDCLVAAALLALLLASGAHASLVGQVGVDSNLLIAGGRVYFAQADGSLTALSLDTGQVLARKTDGRYDGTLVDTPAGIALSRASAFTLLHRHDLKPLWKAEHAWGSEIYGGRLVAHDGKGRVACRELAGGRIRWQYDLPGWIELAAAKGKVMLYRAAPYRAKTPPAIVLLSLETGKPLLRKGPPPGIHYLNAFFDGERIYLPAGRYRTKRSDARFERLVVWDTAGRQLSSRTVSFPGRPSFAWDFELDGKVFWNGHVRPQDAAHGAPPIYGGDACESQSVHRLKGGRVTVREIEGKGVFLELEGKQAGWRGHLPYLPDRYDGVSQVASGSGKLLVGTNRGHVECIDLQTGRSLWLYRFPAILEVSGLHGHPPYYAEQAAESRRLSRDRHPLTGMLLLPRGAEPATFRPPGKPTGTTPVIRDPAPGNPFRRLPRLLLTAWAGALLPCAAVAWLLAGYRRQPSHQVTLAGVAPLLLLLAAFTLIAVGRVSLGSSLALKLMVLGVFAAGLWAVVGTYRQGRRAIAVVCLVLLLTLGYPALALLRYA